MTEVRTTESLLADLPIESIQASTTNPRRHFDPAALDELAKSIAESGLIQRPTVRYRKDEFGVAIDDEYELVVGSRRLAAVKQLGWVTCPVFIRELTDDEAKELQIVENLQRADVGPLEEAEAFQELLGRLGSIQDVARRLGKEERYVAKSLALMKLTLPSRDALRGRLITIEHGRLLAPLAEAEQDAALKWCLDRNAGSKTTVLTVVAQRIGVRIKEEEKREEWGGRFMSRWEPESVMRLKSFIEAESGILLERAPWDLDDAGLVPEAGPCTTCPKNTKVNVPLFGDLEMGAATCTDGACFDTKRAALVRIALRTGEPDAVFPPVRLSWKSTSVKPSIVLNENPTKGNGLETANPAKVLKQGQWIEAKKGSCTNVRAGVMVDWSDDGDRGRMGSGNKLRKPGELLQVCIAVGCKAHRKEWEKPKSQGNQPAQRDPAAEKRAAEERAHVEKEETVIRSKILHAILSKLDAVKAVRLVADRQQNAADWRKRVLAQFPELDGPTLEAYTVLCCEVAHYLRVNGYWLMQPNGVAGDRKEIFAVAKAAGVDAVKVIAKHFHDAGSIAPASDRLYPKGVPWPKGAKPTATVPAKKVAAKPKLTPDRRKAIADAMKKRWAERHKAGKPVAKKVVAKKAVKK